MADTELRVTHAAILLDGVVHWVMRPGRHHHIIHRLATSGYETPIGGEQGFLITGGRFVNRKAALVVACKAGQTTIEKLHGSILTSEDLW